MNVNDGLEDIMWIRRLGGERLPTATYALGPNLLSAIRVRRRRSDRDVFVVCFLHTSRRNSFDLDIESTRGQPASCRARPVNIDDELENSMWIHGLGGETLPAVSYALFPNLEKYLFFAIGQGSRFFVVCFLYTSGRMFFGQTRLAGARHISPAVVCTL